MGAFGPQLKPYARDFKLYGYQSSDGMSHVPPIAVTAQGSFTHTSTDQDPAPTHFHENDNFDLDQVSMYYAGRLPLGFGAFAQLTYDGAARGFNLDNVDVRHATPITVLGKDSVIGFDFNNSPTVEDPWNSTPTWGFPYNGSELVPTPSAATLIDGGLSGQVAGAGAYFLWNDTFYADFTAYSPLDPVLAGRLGEGTNSQSDRFTGLTPYWRVALLHDFGTDQTAEIGTYGLHANRDPQNISTAGTDAITDWAVDGNYQYIGSSRHVISAHATYISERQNLIASSVLFGTRAHDHLSTARADVSYSYENTLTPTLQVFRTTGSADPALYPVSPTSAGYVAELAWVPFGKPNSPVYWANMRLAVQYVGYTEFNGVKHDASSNNSVYVNLWLALAPFGALVHR